MKKLGEGLRISLSNLMPLSNNEKIEILHHINEQDKEIERLNKEVEKYKKRCFKGLKLIRDNYGVLDKYGVDILDDILNGVDKE